MKRYLLLLSVAGLVAIAAVPVLGQSLEGGCTVSANSGIDNTTMVDATRQDPFRVDPGGTISWSANSATAIKTHQWVINVDIAGLAVPVAKGGDPNDAGTMSSVGERSIPDLVEQARASGVPNAELLSSLRGIYRVFGNITGTGTCFGDAYVLIEGNPLTQVVGQVAGGVAVVGALMVVRAGFAKNS